MADATLLSNIANPQNPQIMTPAQGVSLQDMATRAQMNRFDLQTAMQEQQNRQEMDAYMRALNQRGSEIRDPATGVYTTKGILEVAQRYPDLADKIVHARSQALNLTSEQIGRDYKQESEKFKTQGTAISKLLQDNYAQYAVDKASDPETKGRNFKTGWQKSVQEWIDSGTPKKLGFTDEVLQKLKNNPPNPDTIPMTLGKTKDMMERADSYQVGQTLSDSQQPSMPLSSVGQVPQSTDPASGATVKGTDQTTPQGKPIAENEIEVTAKAPPESPDALRAQAARVEKLGTPAAQKKAKELRSSANQLESRIQADERIDQSKTRETRIAAAGEGSKLRPEDANFIADEVLDGYAQAGVGLARNKDAKAQVIRAITDRATARHMSPKDAAMAVAEFRGLLEGETTVGRRQAQIEMAGNVVSQFVPLAKQRSEEFNRFGIKSLNDLQIAVQKRTASPELRRFAAATNAVVNAYARAVNPTGVGNEADKEHAREILDIGFAGGDFNAAADQIMQEIKAELKAPGAVKGGMREFFKGEKGETKSDGWTDADEKRLQELEKKHAQ
jgi:hypothetical protein